MMKLFTSRLLIIAATLALILTACGGSDEETGTATDGSATGEAVTEESSLEGELNLVGSTTVQPLAEVLAESFEALEPGVIVYVQGGGSSVGVRSASDRSADIGMASREVKLSELQEYPELIVHTIARDGITIVVETGCTVESLTKEQARQIFAGEITNWNEVGGENMIITVVAREEGSGTRAAFEDMIMEDLLVVDNAILQPSNGAVRTTISVTPGTIGFLSFGYIDDQTKAIAIDGVFPTEENASSGEYSVVRSLNMVTYGEPEEKAGAFLDFVMSEDGQAIVAEEGYLPVI
ncbi:MAG: phosphate ABC transporter substrate-binding protein [Candidatus Aegiribacteria sp.]|nr:phosphate ABC transporter substrate-binding protein [Candidatus Aegiribacteria sp.]